MGSLPWSAEKNRRSSRPEGVDQRRHIRVDEPEPGGIALRVLAVTVGHVEVDQVREDDPRLGPCLHGLDGLAQSVFVALGVDRVGYSPAREEILDLADGNDRTARPPWRGRGAVGEWGSIAKSWRS